MGIFNFFKKKEEDNNVTFLGNSDPLKIHKGRSCAKCGSTSAELVKANNGMWDGLRFCPKCEKYFCARCQVDNYYESCPLCETNLINRE